MKILNIFFVIIFVISAGLQYNDPDPLLWIAIYLYAAICCWFALRGKYYPKAYLLGIALYLIYAAILFFDKNGVISWVRDHDAESLVTTMKASQPWIEATREFGGLMITSLALFLNWLHSRKIKT